MTKKEFIEKCKELELKGYKKTFKYDGTLHNNGIDYLYKVLRILSCSYQSQI